MKGSEAMNGQQRHSAAQANDVQIDYYVQSTSWIMCIC